MNEQFVKKPAWIGERVSWISILERLRDDPDKVCRIAADSAAHAKKAQNGIYASSGVRVRMRNTHYQIKTHRTKALVYIWLEEKRRRGKA